MSYEGGALSWVSDLIAQVRAAEEGFEFDFEDRSVRRVGSSSHGADELPR